MRRLVPFGTAAITAILAATHPAAAQTRAFVSGLGSDANPCTLSAPCRSFQQAHTTVAAGGEIVALDAAGYGGLTISKAITVTAIGIEASITSNSTTSTGITINAGPSDTVTIRGLTLISGFTAGDGIDINSAKSVTLRDCTISGFPNDGISVGSSANLDVELRGISVSGSGVNGLLILPSGTGALTVTVTDSQFNGNGSNGVATDGESSSGTIKATLSVVAAANAGDGIIVRSAVSGHAQPVVMVTGSKLVNNTLDGLSGAGNVQVFVDRTQISGNSGNGWFSSGAVVKSYTNNNVNGNANDALNGVVQISAE